MNEEQAYQDEKPQQYVDEAEWYICPRCGEHLNPGIFEDEAVKILRKSLSDSQAGEAMKDEALKAAQQFIGPKGSVAGEDHWALVTIIQEALSRPATSWLKRAQAKVWREAAHIVAPDGDPGNDETRELAQTFFDKASELEKDQ